ncbi:TIGR04255 family protein [Desulfolutivibrio sulfoxidireducens]|uniref:TIGR04255 family protein n=1 Tax=Desulfolutivibrio sulfoxidireducens TaxID=2773299 RepID=UPI00159EA3C3|nr:TIGR04255 family protein [Desulfolutivibrio sulfoxidireducens]QLA17176.1 TIGR04255 family protein [Desulfolutivibrio sulfoxidireducens]
MSKELKNKPLVEAIFEMRWKLQGVPSGPQVDPHYKLFLGRLYDRLLTDYPEHEQLQTANIPDELVGHMIQHRFRVEAGGWPLVQIGPGIFTVNSASDYSWIPFRKRVIASIEKLYEAHPKVSDLTVSNMVLRYIDAISFDFTKNNVYDFLREYLKMEVNFPDNLFLSTGVESRPANFTWQTSFNCQNPNGLISIRFATAHKDNAPVVVWETIVETIENDLPELPTHFCKWLDAAHAITDDWFFKMIEGELERRFSGVQ